jgi:hypothetical protein
MKCGSGNIEASPLSGEFRSNNFAHTAPPFLLLATRVGIIAVRDLLLKEALYAYFWHLTFDI